MEEPHTIQRAPDGFEPLSPEQLVADIIHYNQRVWPTPAPGGRWHVGAAAMKPIVSDRKCRPQFPPKSVETAICEFTKPAVYTANMPFVRMASAEGKPFGLETNIVEGMSTIQCCPPATVAIATVEHDRTQLVWSDNRSDDCISGGGCVAAQLANAPRDVGGGRPLPRYRFPGEHGKQEGGGFCLLCIRADAQAMVKVYSSIVACSTRQIGGAAVALPPFQNLVNCPGGYTEQSLGVTPNQTVFSPVSIVGIDIPMTVRVSPRGDVYVDQSAAEWETQQRRNSTHRSADF